jgi:hypothetical protein
MFELMCVGGLANMLFVGIILVTQLFREMDK